MRKSSDIIIAVVISVLTIYFSITCMQAVNDMKEYKKQSMATLESMERHMQTLEKRIDNAITSKQMSGHLIGVRTSLKKILENQEKQKKQEK